ncbi:hypothetical protein MYSTI_02816 [Myxococcus stipitatus DSM 14675]|uniref:Uncharacterized protein n=1 Tax=Myxococcus stipitatus (strain DSM 14675 / JCM 12634 / Mx s8) TaxID=1278073 RepID=L7U976_MYXSD|nr:hypothetical protein [Myxococcus stipitatus]AGC44132.1 hypothetical protein MYSTI_02816 [Myxococcus stipitatus DSM 14675]
MHPWIAIAASLSLAQVSSEYPSPLDPSVRDNSASALRDANEQATEEAEGAWLPPNFVIQQMPGGESPASGAYGGGFDITPVLPDGQAPATSGDVAIHETYQRYQPIPAPAPEPVESGEAEPQGSAQTAPAGAASGTQAPGVGGSGSSGSTQQPAQPSGAPATGGSGGSEAAQPDAQDMMGGFGPTAEEQANGQQQASGGSGTSSSTTPTEGPSTGAGEAPTSPPETTSGTGGAGTPANLSGAATDATPPQQLAPGNAMAGGEAPAGAASSSSTTQPAAPAPQASAAEMEQLRQRVDQLEAELSARDDVIEQNAQATQEQVDTFGDRAVETEQSRQQRLSTLQSAGEWMLAADAALQQGDNDVDNALDFADSAFADIRSSASEFGQGTVTVHAERARALINLARDAAGRSDTYAARVALQDAGVELSLARGASLGRSGTGNSLLTP